MEEEVPYDTISLDTVDTAELEPHCLPCQREGKYKESVCFCVDCDEHLCQGCMRVHRKMRTLQSHKILDETENREELMSHVQEGKESARIIIKPKLCEKHTGALVEYYCTCCNVIGCNKCLISHEQCRTVRVPDITRYLSPLSGQDTLSDKLVQGMSKIADSFGAIQDSVKPNLSDIEFKHSDVALVARDVLVSVKELVEAVMQNVTESVMVAKRENDAICSSETDRVDFALSKLARLTGQSQKVLDKNVGATDIYGELRSTLEETNRLMLASIGNNPELRSKSHHQCMKSTTQAKDFMESMHELISDLELIDIPDSRLGDFSMQTDGDDEQCKITGALLSNKNLIVYDRGNKKIKAFDRDKGQLITELQLQRDFNEIRQ